MRVFTPSHSFSLQVLPLKLPVIAEKSELNFSVAYHSLSYCTKFIPPFPDSFHSLLHAIHLTPLIRTSGSTSSDHCAPSYYPPVSWSAQSTNERPRVGKLNAVSFNESLTIFFELLLALFPLLLRVVFVVHAGAELVQAGIDEGA
jgi:hypothetical protein